MIATGRDCRAGGDERDYRHALIRDLARLPSELRGGAVAIGNFDGVHLGHARIAERLIERAREVGGPAVVFTFDPHPVRILRPQEAPPPLTWTDRKAELLGELGVDAMIAYPTDEELLRLSPEEFFDGIVREPLAAQALVEGPNFNFGRGRAGTIDVLRRLCQEGRHRSRSGRAGRRSMATSSRVRGCES